MTPMQKVRARKWLGRVVAYGALVVVTLAVCFPLMWALSTSLKPKAELSTAPTLIPKQATLENYRHLLTGKAQYFGGASGDYQPTTAPPQYFMSWFGNSVIVSVGSTLISIVISTLAAYSVTRFRYRFRMAVPYFSLLGYMVPSIILVFPLFLVMTRLELTDSLWSLTLGYVSVTLPFCMWLLWAFFRSMFMNTTEHYPLTVGVMLFFEGVHVDWGLMMASAVLMTVPMAVLFMLLQRHLVAGFGAGAVKG